MQKQISNKKSSVIVKFTREVMYSLDLNMLVARFTRVNTILLAELNDIFQKVLIKSKMFGLVRLYDLTSISAIIQWLSNSVAVTLHEFAWLLVLRGVNMSCSRTTGCCQCHGDRFHDLSIRIPMLYHYVSTLPIYFMFVCLFVCLN